MASRSRFLCAAVLLAAVLLPVSGLCSDGAVVSWGRQVIGPSDMVDIIAVSGGDRHTLGLKSDGTVVAWGRNDWGQCDVPAPNEGFVAVAAGSRHSLGLKSDGTVVAWGSNQWSQCNVPALDEGFITIASGTQSFNASAVPGSVPRTLEIFDLTGRLVRRFDLTSRGVGVPFQWDGTDEQGRAVPASVYFGRVTYRSGSVHNRIVRLR